MVAQVLDICDAVVSAIAAGWSPADPDAVSREYVAAVDLEKPFLGRRVFVFPLSYTNGPATRGEDEWVYGVAAVVVERYEEAGPVPKEWIDERVLFVQDEVSGANDYVRELLNIDGRQIWTQTNTPTVYDADRLSTLKLFYSEVQFEFHEILSAE